MNSPRYIYYNIARVLALCKSYWAAMNKFFIYACLSANKDFFMMTCSALFFVSYFKYYPKTDENDEKLCSIFGILLLATQTNSNSREDVSQVIEPESLKILLLRLTFSRKKTTNWFVLGNYPICIKCLCPFLNVCLSFTKQVDCKVSCYRLTIRLKQEKFSGNN